LKEIYLINYMSHPQSMLGEAIRSSHRVGKYSYGEPIARGSFSNVCLGKNLETGDEVAIKIIDTVKHQKLSKYFDREISIIKSLEHPNIVRMLDEFRESQRTFLVFEYCNHGDLVKLTGGKPIKEKYVRKILSQVRNGLGYLHRNGIIHRDLKPQNVLVDGDGVIKITDFGFAKRSDAREIMSETMCGTPYYMAPEIIKNAKYNDKVDLWSFGIMMFQLLAGRLPFAARTHLDLLRKIERNAVLLPHRIKVSGECEDLLYSLLQKDPLKRLDWDDFLEHEWFLHDETAPKIKEPITASQPISIPGTRSNDDDNDDDLQVGPNGTPRVKLFDNITEYDPDYIMISPSGLIATPGTSYQSQFDNNEDPPAGSCDESLDKHLKDMECITHESGADIISYLKQSLMWIRKKIIG